MFSPGHLHIAHLPSAPQHRAFTLDLHYEIRQDAAEGPMLSVRVLGNVDGEPFEDAFELHRDSAFDFASVACGLAAKRGLTAESGLVLTQHDEYDQMFEDIRRQLDIEPGDPINFDHFDKDRL
ncbi:DUF5064 family protein [Pseudomonas matsuisoli]|uniref:DUF5064 domain-containing protein n=1 Tax=Pseudomonas matsuisoli TaxID=1515666 RepID=A0A917PSI1_9PSED|nr:DUF5064 family protein [Pseudomonas matsuisoli]GGJ90395.1 DUF5064 domain-containing protein [Pseudomonas matsuisoli]